MTEEESKQVAERNAPKSVGGATLLGGANTLLAVLDLAPICVREMDGTVLYWSRGIERLYGWSPVEALGQVTHSLLQTRFPKPLPEIEADLLRTGQWNGELRHRTRQGDDIWVASNWVLHSIEEDSSMQVIEINNNVTDRKRADDVFRYLGALVGSSDDAIISKDLDGIVTSWNSSAERLFGYTASEMIAQPITLLFPPELVGEEPAIMARLRKGERVDHHETERLTKSGRRIPVSLTISPITDADGNLIGASKIVRDISQKRYWEEALRQSENRRRLAVEAGEIGLWSYKVPSLGPDWDTRCKLIFGLSPDAPSPDYREAIGFVHGEDQKQVDRSFQETVSTGKPFDIEFRILDQSGRVRWLEAKGRPSLNEKGEVIDVHGTIVDFTVRKQREETLRRTNDELQQFAYAAAHDLQEPLRNVALSIQLAQHTMQKELDEKTRTLLNGAVRNAQKMESMIKDLLGYSRALSDDNGHWPVIDSCEVLAQALENLAAEVNATSAKITWDALPNVHMEKVHLLQIFQNLISNSLKYRGPKTPVIHIAASTRPGFQQFSVQDNGIGVAPQYQRRVFGLFKRLKENNTPGTGIGLALCKRIVEHYGGEIWIESTPNEGATFLFTVPATEKPNGLR